MSKAKVGLIGGLVGVAAGALAVGVTVVERSASARKGVDLDRFRPLPADRHGEVVADDGVGLYYEQIGPLDAELTVVFVHGFTLTMDAFVLQRERLVDHYGPRVRLIFYDHRSHGRSDRSDSKRATIEQLGDDLDSLLQTLVPSGPLVLVGHSMGGMTVLALADSRPELFLGASAQVRGVVLMSTSTGKLASVTYGLPAALAKLKGPILPLLLRGARQQPGIIERGRALGTDVAWVVTKRLSFARDVEPAMVEFLTRMIAGTRIDVIADFFGALMDHDKLAALDVLRSVPTLVVCGDSDAMTPPEHSQQIAASLPDARLVVVEEAGHMALMEAADEVNDELIDFVDEVLTALPANDRLSARRQLGRRRRAQAG